MVALGILVPALAVLAAMAAPPVALPVGALLVTFAPLLMLLSLGNDFLVVFGVR